MDYSLSMAGRVEEGAEALAGYQGELWLRLEGMQYLAWFREERVWDAKAVLGVSPPLFMFGIYVKEYKDDLDAEAVKKFRVAVVEGDSCSEDANEEFLALTTGPGLDLFQAIETAQDLQFGPACLSDRKLRLEREHAAVAHPYDYEEKGFSHVDAVDFPGKDFVRRVSGPNVSLGMLRKIHRIYEEKFGGKVACEVGDKYVSFRADEEGKSMAAWLEHLAGKDSTLRVGANPHREKEEGDLAITTVEELFPVLTLFPQAWRTVAARRTMTPTVGEVVCEMSASDMGAELRELEGVKYSIATSPCGANWLRPSKYGNMGFTEACNSVMKLGFPCLERACHCADVLADKPGLCYLRFFKRADWRKTLPSLGISPSVAAAASYLKRAGSACENVVLSMRDGQLHVEYGEAGEDVKDLDEVIQLDLSVESRLARLLMDDSDEEEAHRGKRVPSCSYDSETCCFLVGGKFQCSGCRDTSKRLEYMVADCSCGCDGGDKAARIEEIRTANRRYREVLGSADSELYTHFSEKVEPGHGPVFRYDKFMDYKSQIVMSVPLHGPTEGVFTRFDYSFTAAAIVVSPKWTIKAGDVTLNVQGHGLVYLHGAGTLWIDGCGEYLPVYLLTDKTTHRFYHRHMRTNRCGAADAALADSGAALGILKFRGSESEGDKGAKELFGELDDEWVEYVCQGKPGEYGVYSVGAFGSVIRAGKDGLEIGRNWTNGYTVGAYLGPRQELYVRGDWVAVKSDGVFVMKDAVDAGKLTDPGPEYDEEMERFFEIPYFG